MPKIRVQELARRMGVENQDLIFQLKSIGVRVEGEDPVIDSDGIQAILQGKKLAAPREVILRDDDAPAKAAPGVGRVPMRPPGSHLRPTRRTMIQRVEPRIREIEVRNRPPAKPAPGAAAAAAPVTAAPAPSPPPEVAAPAPTPPAPPVAEARPAVTPEVKPARPKARKAKPTPEVKPAKPRKAKPGVEEPRPEVKAARPEVEAPRPGVKAAPPEVKAATPAAVKPAAPARPEAEAPKVKAAPPEVKPAPKVMEAPRAKAERVAGPPKAAPPKPARPAVPSAAPRRARRPVRPAPPPASMSRRLPPLAAMSQAEEVPIRKPASERGRRRAQRKQDEPTRDPGILQFKSERPSGPVTISEGMTVREFAEKLGVKAKDLIRTLVSRGIMANINHVLDTETAGSVARELGVETMEVTFEEEVQLQHETELEGVDLKKTPRAPVVTVMGHVDHGKTTLLDHIRATNVAAGEAGGITQHIGAYQVAVDGRKIVFLDTPGHEAFTMMRARGARATDVVVLVVAADDGVMPQTVEAIDHARAAGVPIVVAINKIDKANANLDRVRKDLSDHGLVVEDWGGDTVSVAISALKGKGISDLLEMVLITADLLELKGSPELPAQGVVLEARKEIGRGIVATILVQDGTLHTGDLFVAGATWGRVRLMTDDQGQRLSEAGPATPIEVTGLTEVPAAGDVMQVMADEAKARSIAQLRRHEDRQRELAPQPGRMSLEQLFSKINQGEGKELAVVLKADVHGSVEVVRETLEKLSTDKVRLNVLHAAVGAITTNDVLLASASEAIIVGFNVRPERTAASLAEKEQVDVRLHTVIYELNDEIRRAMAGMLEPVYREVHTGTAEIRDTFRVPKVGVVAGCHIVDGLIPRSAAVRLLRDNRVVYEGRIASLKRFKEDVSEVRSGFDCGIGLEHFQDLKPGDSIEAFVREEITPSL